MDRPRLPNETTEGLPYPEGRNTFGLSDVSVCGPLLLTPAELEFLLQAISEQGTYLEIGSWTAATLAWIADRRPGVHCVGVDCFEGTPARRLLAALVNWDQRPNVDLYLGRVEHLAWLPASCDAALVDADHRGAAVYRDLGIAAGLIKPGGVLLAHDYGKPDHAEVGPAVDRHCTDRGWRIVDRADSLVLMRAN